MASALKQSLLKQLQDIADSGASPEERMQAIEAMHALLAGGTYDEASALIGELRPQISRTR